ncbi:DUF4286 family protein [Amycolatopsis sp. Poz14]|uniref:DUF4286 family protein n=1 Tax=Amycolatopsis sp. Poz14 TaxID=1447705 RepID=UPI001EE7F129|nr:DUF4286 family protein [Amycolatopsis sp. Poz14]MCG3753953.1 hypothetical protein [Amycolatopsis sp. Poz14]
MALAAPATRCLYVVRAVFGDPDREARWNDWYDREHVPNLLSVPGFVSATRFKQLDLDGHYLAWYEIESPRVFEQERYAEVTGWGEWADAVVEWTRTVYRLDDALPVENYVRSASSGGAGGNG